MTGTLSPNTLTCQPLCGANPAVGHVACVTEIYPSRNAVVISEMTFVGWNQADTRTISPAFGVDGLQYTYVKSVSNNSQTIGYLSRWSMRES